MLKFINKYFPYSKAVVLGIIIIGGIVTLYAQSIGTPSQLRVKIDSTGALAVSSAAITNPVFTTTFNQARLKLDSSGNLVVTDGGGAGFAPADATYITQSANSTLSAEVVIPGLTATSAAYSLFGNFTSSTAAPGFTANPTVGIGSGTQIAKLVSGTTICNQINHTGSTGGGGTTVVATCTIPLNTINADGQKLRADGCALHAANTNSTTFGITVFGTALNTATEATSGGLACAGIDIFRNSSSVADVHGFTDGSGAFTQNRNHITGLNYAASLTVTMTINAPTTTNDLVSEFLRLTWYSE